jgi:hypothetical protein
MPKTINRNHKGFYFTMIESEKGEITVQFGANILPRIFSNTSHAHKYAEDLIDRCQLHIIKTEKLECSTTLQNEN